MRTTNNMLINNMMFYMKNNLERLSKYQTQLASGKKITVPSDDPIVASRALKFRTDVSQVTQFQSNAKDATSWMDITEDALGKMGDIMQTVYNRAVQAANTGTMTPEDRDKIRQEVIQLRDQLIHLGNTSYAGRYIFSGHDTDTKLLNDDGTYATSVSSRETAVIKSGLIEFPITIDATNNTFDISLTGGGYKTVALAPGVYATADDLAAEIQNSIIAADPAAFEGIRVKNNDGRLEFSLGNTSDSQGNNLQIYLRKGAAADLLDAVKVKTDVISGITVSKSEDINYQVGIGDLLNVNVLGSELFGSGVKGDIGEVILKLNNFIDSLAYTDDKSYISGQTLKADSLNPLVFNGSEEFSITIDGMSYDITLPAKTYDGDAVANQTLDDLAQDLQTQINSAISADGFSVTVENNNGRIVISEDSGKKIMLTEGAAGVDALRKLKIYTGVDKTVTSFTGTEGLNNAISDTQGINDKILSIRADIGARMNRSELTLNRLESDELNFIKLMSDNEDVDMAEAIINLTNEENVYNASLAGSARIIMPSLVDFLK